VFRYIALGFIQGFTEFLPISSSGHLVVLQELFGLKGSNTLFDSLLHLGTLVSVLLIFRARIGKLILSVFNGSREDRKYLLQLVIATVPIAVVGFLARDFVEAAFGSIRSAGIGLLITGVVLWSVQYARRSDRGPDSFSWRDASFIGIAQVAALFPGISRSGVTISAGLFKKLDPDFAAEFSFILMVPAVLGANVLKIGEGLMAGPETSIGLWGYFLGTLTAAITGVIAIKWLLNLLRKGELTRFAYYCLPLGAIVLVWSFL